VNIIELEKYNTESLKLIENVIILDGNLRHSVELIFDLSHFLICKTTIVSDIIFHSCIVSI